MTLPDFGRLLATVDPDVKHHVSAKRGWRVQVERYTRDEYDEVAEALYDLLQHRDNVAVQYMMDSEGDGEDLVIRHLFDCEVW